MAEIAKVSERGKTSITKFIRMYKGEIPGKKTTLIGETFARETFASPQNSRDLPDKHSRIDEL